MTVKQMVPLPIAAGVYSEETERGAKGRWRRADKVRFRKGLPEKIGGWIQLAPVFRGKCRRIIDWTALDGSLWTAIATELKLYLWQDEILHDITPLRAVGQLTNPFDTVASSTTVTVNHSGHGTQKNDFVHFKNASAFGGLTVDGEYQVITVIDANKYTITDDETATSTLNGGGGTVDFEYEIITGKESAVAGLGWGTGTWSQSTWNTERASSTTTIPLRTWALDNWGEDLVASPRGGAIYRWDKTNGPTQRAIKLPNAPPFNEYIILSQRDRHLVALGAFDFFNQQRDELLIRWCSTEDLDDWVPISTNTAGDIRLYRGSKIVTAIRTRGELILFTDVSVHSMPFVGFPAVFGLLPMGENVSILGPNAAVAVDYRVLFMAESDFYIYDGILKVLACDVRNFIYDNLTVAQKDKVYGGLNREFNEVWWFYPSSDPDAWLQSNFELKLPFDYELAQPSTGGTAGYTYKFNAAGFTEVSATIPSNGYEYDFVLVNDEEIEFPLTAEYAVEIDISPLQGAGVHNGGLCFLRQDITGTIDTAADDVKQFMVELDFDANEVAIRLKNPTGAIGFPANQSSAANFTTVTGSAMVTGVKYNITVQVDTPRIRVWVDSNLAFDFNMDATELTDHTGGSAGLHVRSVGVTANDEFRFYNFAAGPVGILTDVNFDISPNEVNRYAAFNYEEGSWTTGILDRTAWHDRSPILEKAYAAGTDGFLYQHETGTDDDGKAMAVSIESYDMEIGNGEYLMHVDQLVPDFLTLQGSVSVSLTGRKYPGDTTRISKGPYTVVPGTRKLSTRMRARQVAIKVESTGLGDKWRMSQWRGRAGAHGKRG